MRKKILLFLSAAMLSVFPSLARDFEYKDEGGQTLIYTVLDEDAKTCETKQGEQNFYPKTITPGNSVSGKLVIPSLVSDGENNYTVTQIGMYGFSTCEITGVEFPNTLLEISYAAFQDCPLKDVILPLSVETVFYNAFQGCPIVKYAAKKTFSYPLGTYTDCIIYTEDDIVENGLIYNSDRSELMYASTALEGEISLPDGMTSIGKSLFKGCSGLSSISLPDGMTSIGDSAFEGCSGLSTISLPDGLTSIGESAFWGCSGLNSITIPQSVASIGGYAFYDCSGLKMADFSSIDHLCLIEFGNELSNPMYYTKKLYINGEEVKEVNIPDGVTSISYTFSGCSGLTSITIPESVTSIGAYTFYGCNGLTSITIPEKVTSIGKWAFYGCSGLSSITIPQLVTSIGSSAFEGCSGLNSITVPQSVASIGGYAFDGCNLESVKVMGSNPPTIDSSGFNDETYNNAILDISQSSLNAYLSTPWNNFKNIYADGYNTTRTYEDGVFKYRLIENPANREAILIAGDYSELTEGTVPQRFTDESDPANLTRYEVIAIGPDAFKNCTNLKSLSFNSRSTINSIGSSAFEGCTSLTLISLPNTVKTIEQNAFSNSGLREINFNDALETIGANAFRNCSSLTEISLPLALTSIGDYAFSNSGLSKVNLSDNITSLASYAFADCKNLKSVSLNDGLVKIGQYVFNGCSNLTSISISESVEEIGRSAFYDCTSLKTADFKSVADVCKIKFENVYANPIYYAKKLHINGEEVTELEIPQTVTEIGYSAFRNCVGLTKVVIPNSVTSLGYSAFRNCVGLTKVVIPNSVTSLGYYAFENCSGLTDLTVGNSLNEISGQFDGCTSLKSLTLADGVNPIDLSGLDITSNLTSLYMGREILNANGFSNLETLEVGNAVEKIKDSEFSGCGYLASLTLGGGLTSIGESAFANCVKLAEVVVPQNVETIGASAFAGNTSLSEITMGYAVKTIGEKAFDGCPASIVRITAQTPPTAPNNTFSNYTGKLWLQDPGDNSVIDAYYDAYTCWDRFDSYAMIVATDIKYEGDQTLVGNAGDTFSLRATLEPADVTLPQIFWYSTNPAVATVDANGLVTLQKSSNEVAALAEGEDYAECKIIGESLYADGPKVEITVNNLETGVDIISGGDFSNNNGAIDYDSPVEVFTINGMRVASSMENLAPGIYVIRQGSKVEKRMIK